MDQQVLVLGFNSDHDIYGTTSDQELPYSFINLFAHFPDISEGEEVLITT